MWKIPSELLLCNFYDLAMADTLNVNETKDYISKEGFDERCPFQSKAGSITTLILLSSVYYQNICPGTYVCTSLLQEKNPTQHTLRRPSIS